MLNQVVSKVLTRPEGTSEVNDRRVPPGHVHGLPDRMTISRWRRKLNDPDACPTTRGGRRSGLTLPARGRTIRRAVVVSPFFSEP